jgi:hypothetical protein
LNEIIKGKRGINTELALFIGKALKMEPPDMAEPSK